MTASEHPTGTSEHRDDIHDDELDTSEEVVRSLLRRHCPDWGGLGLTRLANSGTSNALWRVHGDDDGDLVVRLPRTIGAERSILSEFGLLPALVATSLAAPAVGHCSLCSTVSIVGSTIRIGRRTV